MKTNAMRVVRAMLVLGLVSTGCVDGGEDEAAAEDAEIELDERGGLLCLYNSTPPATDASATVVGAPDEAESEDFANGGCDFHMFRVTASPAADRVRTINFGASSYDGLSDYGARVWTKSCVNGICPVAFTPTAVPLTLLPGHCIHPDINTTICFPDIAYGELQLSATNNVVDIRAGMRATDDDGDEVEVTITVSE